MRLTLVVTGAIVFVSLGVVAEEAMFRGSLVHSGVYEAAGVPRFNKVKWSFHTGGMVIGSPTVTGGVVYVGSDDGNFYAIEQGYGSAEVEVCG
ncbi:MAG TPA: PQQ-binding-like beta-propeller repeat protein [Candidatus Sulfotelmatobacter sp.]|nr:PQQ-binding-like beta-propeller repeat protein [Candidatus Sulfotelmatobacter sp.]